MWVDFLLLELLLLELLNLCLENDILIIFVEFSAVICWEYKTVNVDNLLPPLALFIFLLLLYGLWAVVLQLVQQLRRLVLVLRVVASVLLQLEVDGQLAAISHEIIHRGLFGFRRLFLRVFFLFGEALFEAIGDNMLEKIILNPEAAHSLDRLLLLTLFNRFLCLS